MKFEKFKIENVDEKGIVKSGGAVHTDGGIRIVKGGCPLENCHCSDGYSISLIMPRNENGVIEGIRVKFDSLEELEIHLQ